MSESHETPPRPAPTGGPAYRETPFKPQPDRVLPFAAWWPVLAGALAGVVLRSGVFTGQPGQNYDAMDGAFIYLAPLLSGAVTVFVAELSERRSWGYYAITGMLGSLLFVAGTMIILIEGLICALLIAPMFMVLGIIGGLTMGAVCRLTTWAKQTLFGLAVLPVLLGAQPPLQPPDHIETVTRTLTIAAPAHAIWESINDTRSVAQEQLDSTWIYAIGVPKPTSGISQATDTGRVRTVTLQQGARFEQEFLEWEPDRHARWRYRFTPESFPPGTLDEHVRIGGHYFDLLVGELDLQPRGANTVVTLRVSYRVSTEFNWYAVPLARLLVGNLEESILDYYRGALVPRTQPAQGAR